MPVWSRQRPWSTQVKAREYGVTTPPKVERPLQAGTARRDCVSLWDLRRSRRAGRAHDLHAQAKREGGKRDFACQGRTTTFARCDPSTPQLNKTQVLPVTTKNSQRFRRTVADRERTDSGQNKREHEAPQPAGCKRVAHQM